MCHSAIVLYHPRTLHLLQVLEQQTAAAQANRVLPHVSYLDGRVDDPNVTLAADASANTKHAQDIHMMLLQLALNHTVMMETLYDKDEKPIGTALSASSPDEVR